MVMEIDEDSQITNRKRILPNTLTFRKNTTNPRPADQGANKGKVARSVLYEICAANHWKPPLFECCNEDGPIHHTMFTFKVIIEMEKPSRNIIECYGAPHQKKKAAADHAAEGVLWYLKENGICNEKPKPVNK